MSQYPLWTDLDALTANSAGKLRAKTFHIEDPLEAVNYHLEALVRAAFAPGGGVVEAGAHTHDDSAKTIQVAGYVGVIADGSIVLYVMDETVDYSSLGAVKALVVARAEEVYVERTFTDPETSESITHNMVIRRGKLVVVEGDASNYPGYAGPDAPVGYLDNTASPATYTPYRVPPPYRFPAGATADRPSSPPTGYAYFDTDLGKPIWWNGSAWVDSGGNTV